jgi:hypothetical protein
MSDANNFFNFIRKILSDANNIESDNGHLILDSIAYQVMDTLSKSINGSRENNCARFQTFIKTYANWPDGERVSLPHIARIIEIIPTAFSSNLKDIVKAKLTKWGCDALQSIDNDPFLTELENFWPQSLPEQFKRFKLQSFQHWSLLYCFRNDLLHELKMLGEGFRPGYDKPYYYLTHIEPTFRSRAFWRLYYPPSFLKKLALNCLDSTEKYFNENGKDPYQNFDLGIFIFKELNSY